MRGRSVWYNYSYYGQPITAVYIMRRRRRRPHTPARAPPVVQKLTYCIARTVDLPPLEQLRETFEYHCLVTSCTLSSIIPPPYPIHEAHDFQPTLGGNYFKSNVLPVSTRYLVCFYRSLLPSFTRAFQ